MTTLCTSTKSESRSIQLKSGILHLCIQRAELPLDELCDFASRQNAKRGFLFVSKVLGKHWPVRPGTMARIHQQLATHLKLNDQPTAFVAMAETAIGLGNGVYDAVLEHTPNLPSIILQTTRYTWDDPLLFESLEPHSHAPMHRVYLPRRAAQCQLLERISQLVIIDDEMSTGTTAANVLAGMLEACPHIRQCHVVSITNWMSPANRLQFAENFDIPVRFISLLDGEFTFETDADFFQLQPEQSPANATGSPVAKDWQLSLDRLGRTARHACPNQLLTQLPVLSSNQRILVLGSGEFLHSPFLLARHLEEHGHLVHFQSTTRSPILLGAAIASKHVFTDHHLASLPNYLYNVNKHPYDKIIIVMEGGHVQEYDLPQQLGGLPIFH